MNNPCLCGCGTLTKWPGAKYAHGHHLRLKQFQRKPIKPDIINTCKFCKKDFVARRRRKKADYCSQECWQAYQRTGKSFICIYCKQEFYLPLNALTKKGAFTKKKKYCSRSCVINDWNAKSIKRQMPGSYRINAWKVYEKKCYDCGITDERVLVIHHIDGNRKNGLLTNLIPVCHNCHCIRHIEMSGNHKLPSYRRGQH